MCQRKMRNKRKTCKRRDVKRFSWHWKRFSFLTDAKCFFAFSSLRLKKTRGSFLVRHLFFSDIRQSLRWFVKMRKSTKRSCFERFSQKLPTRVFFRGFSHFSLRRNFLEKWKTLPILTHFRVVNHVWNMTIIKWKTNLCKTERRFYGVG